MQRHLALLAPFVRKSAVHRRLSSGMTSTVNWSNALTCFEKRWSFELLELLNLDFKSSLRDDDCWNALNIYTVYMYEIDVYSNRWIYAYSICNCMDIYVSYLTYDKCACKQQWFRVWERVMLLNINKPQASWRFLGAYMNWCQIASMYKCWIFNEGFDEEWCQVWWPYSLPNK